MPWDPTIYSTFAAPRLRPAVDLLARIGADAPGRVADLGCGTGNVTRLLAERWPNAEVTGIDSSPEMLATARQAAGRVRWVEADIATWAPTQPVDVLYSNAALHWLGDHGALFRRLMDMVVEGGWLAVQMPHNHHAASHTAMADAAAAGPWAEALAPVLRDQPVADAAFYYDALSPFVDQLDIWETEYLHVLAGDNPVVTWTTGTALRPLLDRLDEPWRAQFLADYSQRIRAAYPPRADGHTLLPFRRMFIVARK
jgi:trans-aconitate 2-methyltransferase